MSCLALTLFMAGSYEPSSRHPAAPLPPGWAEKEQFASNNVVEWSNFTTVNTEVNHFYRGSMPVTHPLNAVSNDAFSMDKN